MVHWCLLDTGSGKPCCESDAQSWTKLASMLTSLLANAYPVPLLYRLKHYASASSFVRVGCCLHAIFPRALLRVGQTSSSEGSMSELVDMLLAQKGEASQTDVGGRKLTEQDLQTLISNVLDGDENYSAKNGARLQMAQTEVCKPRFHQNAIVVDLVVQCMERGLNFLLRRTKLLYDLQYMSYKSPQQAELQKELRDKCLHLVRGGLADELLQNYMGLLGGGLAECISMGLEGTGEQLTLIWEIVIGVITDLHRRMDREFYTLLALADVDLAVFAREWNALQRKYLLCPCCVDCEFTTGLFSAYPDVLSVSLPCDVQIIAEIQEFLCNLCTWTPLTSDAVEILHGQLQWALSRRGGQHVKHGKAAVEVSLLGQAVKQHAWIANAVRGETMPAKATSSAIKRNAQTISSNHFSQRDEDCA